METGQGNPLQIKKHLKRTQSKIAIPAKKFVELHGGKIWVESEPGKGSTNRRGVVRESEYNGAIPRG